MVSGNRVRSWECVSDEEPQRVNLQSGDHTIQPTTHAAVKLSEDTTIPTKYFGVVGIGSPLLRMELRQLLPPRPRLQDSMENIIWR